jgi:hypothetical protein
MYLGAGGRGRVAGEIRRRVAALIALSGIAAMPAASGAAAPGHAATFSVSVTPRTGSGRTHFVVSFRAALSTAPALHNIYRVTAGVPGHAGCQAGVAAQAPPSKVGSTVRVVLSPSRSAHWCTGTFRGQVWDVITEPCPVGKACPAIITPPLMVGKFSFRVTRGWSRALADDH